jgi:hypothetical protein
MSFPWLNSIAAQASTNCLHFEYLFPEGHVVHAGVPHIRRKSENRGEIRSIYDSKSDFSRRVVGGCRGAASAAVYDHHRPTGNSFARCFHRRAESRANAIKC